MKYIRKPMTANAKEPGLRTWTDTGKNKKKTIKNCRKQKRQEKTRKNRIIQDMQ